MSDDTYKQVRARLAKRQKLPRNFKVGSPRSLGATSHRPYPSNVLYGRPRTVNSEDLDDETVAN